MPGPGVEDVAGVGGVAVGEHRAPVHRPQQLEVLLALVRVPDSVALPQNTAEQVTVLPDQVITAAGFLHRQPLKLGSDPAMKESQARR